MKIGGVCVDASPQRQHARSTHDPLLVAVCYNIYKSPFFHFFVDGFSVSGEIIGIHVRNELSGGCFGECHLASESRSRTVFGGAVAFRGNNPAKNAFFEKLNNVNLKKEYFRPFY